MAVSMLDDRDTLARRMRRRPDRMGTHLLTLDVPPGHGVCVADTGGPHHWSIWGIPAQLLEFVADDIEHVSA
jgi:hypothetical protein